MLAKGRQAGPKMEHTLSDFMNAKIEMSMREEESDPHQHSMGSDSAAYPAPSSSGSRLQVPGPMSGQGPMSGGQGLGSRPSSRASNEIQSSVHEGAVSSTAASSDLAESSQTLSGEVEGRDSQVGHTSQPSSEAASFLGRSGGVTTSSAETTSPLSSSASSRAMSPSVGSTQSTPQAKKRIMHRPRFRGDDPPAPAPSSGEKFSSYPASSSREHPRSSATLPATSTKAGSPADVARSVPPSKAPPPGAGASSKEKKSDLYDFPDDSPDEECSGRTPSSYMALATPGRSPRKGHVDSSDSSKPAGEASAVGSSVDDRRGGGDQENKDSNEAQGYESYASSSSLSLHDSRHYSRREAGDVTSGSAVDSTHADKTASSSGDDSGAIDSSTIDSSTCTERKPGKQRMSPRRAPDDPSEGFEPSESAQGRSMEGMAYSQHSRSPRARAASTEGGTGFGGVDSSSSNPMGSGSGSGANPSMSMVGYPPYPNPGSGQPVVSSIMRESEHQTICSRDQEPAPLLSAQYETLSDDDDN